MNIEQRKVIVGEVCEGYFNDAEEGVVGYDERLDIRPKYQREFVYKDAQRDEVIRTVMKGLPLNVMYWCKVKKENGSDCGCRNIKKARRRNNGRQQKSERRCRRTAGRVLHTNHRH